MTIQEMQRNFMIKLRQFVKEPDVESDDVEYYLNRAIEDFTKQQHFIIRDAYRTDNISSMSVQRAIENLRTLIHTKIFVYQGDAGDPQENEAINSEEIMNGIVISLTANHFSPLNGVPYAYYLRSRLDIDSIGINCRIIDTNNLSKYTQTKYNTPLFREPAVLLEGNKLTVIYPTDLNVKTSSADIRYFLTYITNPAAVSIRLNLPCNLPEHTHNDIVDLAVEMKIADFQKSNQVGIKVPQAAVNE